MRPGSTSGATDGTGPSSTPTRLGPLFAVLLPAIALVSGCDGPGPASGPPAELVVVDADVRTADPELPTADALAVRDGRFVAVGSRAEIEALADAGTRRVDADGATILPGFIDGHLHLASGASTVAGVYLYGIADKQEWLRRVAERAAELESGRWITGGRWDHTLLPDREFPTRGDLDRVAPANPVALRDVDGHTLWANSAAIQAAGIDASTPDPPGGRILRDDSGDPTGIFLETAGGLISDEIPAPTPAQRREQLRQAIAFANRRGVTGAHDMAGADVLGQYEALRDAGDLTLRIWYGATGVDPTTDVTEWRDRREALAANGPPDRGPSLELGYLKLMIDGVLSAHTAALLEPYADRPDTSGLPRYDQQTLTERVVAANEGGFPVAIHAIGDRGVRMSLNAFEEALERVGPPPLPNRIEHVEVVAPEDAPRFARSGVLASMQPHHCITGIDVYNTLRLGRQRVEWAFAWERLRQAGATLVFGTDWPTAPIDPLRQLYAAVLREKPGGGPPGGWTPDNRVPFDVALAAYTRNAAAAAGWDDEVGTITEGKWADFVVLDGPLPEPLDRRVLERRVRATYLAGNAVHSSPDEGRDRNSDPAR